LLTSARKGTQREQGKSHRVPRSPNTARPYDFHCSGDDSYGYTPTKRAKSMPYRSKILSTPEFSWKAMEERVCYERNAGRELLLKQLLMLVSLRR